MSSFMLLLPRARGFAGPTQMRCFHPLGPSMRTRFASSSAAPAADAAAGSSVAPADYARLHPDARAIVDTAHPAKNVSPMVLDKIGRRLHLLPSHPLCIMKRRVEDYCARYAASKGQTAFAVYDDLSPIVTSKSCFDDLLIPPEHVSRQKSDTYYITDSTLLRTHTSAHQVGLMRSEPAGAFLCSGDVYRRDEIDASHYPVFHQMEGVRLFDKSVPLKVVEEDLKGILTGLCQDLFGKDVTMRWNEDYFPFTTPSFEVEVMYQDKWLEVLGCGIIHEGVLKNAGVWAGEPLNAGAAEGKVGWAFGLGLERLAMVLFGIPDIRLFWSDDPRFLSQFKEGEFNTKFQPFSKFPPCYKDVSFWLPDAKEGASDFHINEVYEVIRDVAGDLVENVELFDTFVHPKTGRTSQAYRINYRHMGRSLLNEEVDRIQARVRDTLVSRLRVTLR